MQYVQGLLRLGVDVYWLDRLASPSDRCDRTPDVTWFLEMLDAFGLREKAIIYDESDTGKIVFINVTEDGARRTFRRADLLLNFDYRIAPEVLASFDRTALIDIDPGLLQFWVFHRQLTLPPHDLYFTTGETVGTPHAAFPNIDIPWIHIRPPVCLDLWPFTYDPGARKFTTVSSWDGGEWVGEGPPYWENNKRVTFMEYVDLPRRTRQELELAVYLRAEDAAETASLVEHGWSVRHSRDVASTPKQYRSFIQTSRGEFSCAKPSCLRFQNGWISDRTLCYLASGKPAVVQYTGPNPYLPEGEGLFRFRNLEEAAGGLETINRDYERHCKAARGIAEAFYDATSVLEGLMAFATGTQTRSA